MRKLTVIFQEIKKMQARYLRAQKKKPKKRSHLRIEFIRKGIETHKSKISNQDLATLHKKVANNESDKQYFLNSLYDKYFISKETHRISIRDGEIFEKKF